MRELGLLESIHELLLVCACCGVMLSTLPPELLLGMRETAARVHALDPLAHTSELPAVRARAVG